MRQSEQEKARRAKRRRLFLAGMCLKDCGRRAARGQNLCLRCTKVMCDLYFSRRGCRV